jgi:membrane protein DedA with SNARE-associated domain
VIAGTLHTNPKQYAAMVFLSAILWSGGFVAAGWLIAPYWNLLVDKINPADKWIYTTPFLLISGVVTCYYLTKRPSAIPSEPVKPYHETTL